MAKDKIDGGAGEDFLQSSSGNDIIDVGADGGIEHGQSDSKHLVSLRNIGNDHPKGGIKPSQITCWPIRRSAQKKMSISSFARKVLIFIIESSLWIAQPQDEKGECTVKVFWIAACVAFIGVGSAQAEEIIGKVAGMSSEGIIALEDGRIVAQWGVQINESVELSEFLLGRRIECIVLQKETQPIVGDCRVAPSERLPSSRREFLDLLTWLPLLGYGSKSCDGTVLVEPLSTFDRLVGNVGYACRLGHPVRSEAHR